VCLENPTQTSTQQEQGRKTRLTKAGPKHAAQAHLPVDQTKRKSNLLEAQKGPSAINRLSHVQ